MADNRNGQPFSASDAMHAQWDVSPELVSLTTSTAKTAAAYSAGLYMVTASADCFVKSGTQAGVTVTATTGIPLWSKGYLLWQVTSADNAGLAGITASGTATLYICKIHGVQS